MSKPSVTVYVDRFNLYKGQMENRTAHKWLNLVSLFDDVLDNFRVVRVHYFTARIKGPMNPEDPGGTITARTMQGVFTGGGSRELLPNRTN